MENDLTDFYLKIDTIDPVYKCYNHVDGNRMYFNKLHKPTADVIRLDCAKKISKGPIRFYVNAQKFTVNISVNVVNNSTFYEDVNPIVLKNIIIKKGFSFMLSFVDLLIDKPIIYRNCLVYTDVKLHHIKYENCEFRRLT